MKGLFHFRRQLLSLSVAILAVALLSATEQASGASWDATKRLADRKDTGCHVANLPTGEVFAAWKVRRVTKVDGRRAIRYSAYTATRDRSGRWSGKRLVWTYAKANDLVLALCPLIAPSPDGSADLVWTGSRTVAGERRPQEVTLTRHLSKKGRLGPTRTLARKIGPRHVITNERGAALVVLGDAESVVSRSPSGRWGAPQTTLRNTKYNINPSIAMNSRGDAIIAWAEPGRNFRRSAMAVTRARGGRFSAPRQAVVCGTRSSDVIAAISDAGEAAVAAQCVDVRKSGERISTAVARSSDLRTGAWRPSTDAVSLTNPPSDAPRAPFYPKDHPIYHQYSTDISPIGLTVSPSGRARVSYRFDHRAATLTYSEAADRYLEQEDVVNRHLGDTIQDRDGTAWGAPVTSAPNFQGSASFGSILPSFSGPPVISSGDAEMVVLCQDGCFLLTRRASETWGNPERIEKPRYAGFYALAGRFAAYLSDGTVRTRTID